MPMLTIRPHSGEDGSGPKPMKLSAAKLRIAVPISRVARMTAGAMQLGKMVRKSM